MDWLRIWISLIKQVYSEDVERLEPDDEEDVDPAMNSKRKKDIFSLYEH